jgi:hypothetical protein
MRNAMIHVPLPMSSSSPGFIAATRAAISAFEGGGGADAAVALSLAVGDVPLVRLLASLDRAPSAGGGSAGALHALATRKRTAAERSFAIARM